MVANQEFIDIGHKYKWFGLTGERSATETGTLRSGRGSWKSAHQGYSLAAYFTNVRPVEKHGANLGQWN